MASRNYNFNTTLQRVQKTHRNFIHVECIKRNPNSPWGCKLHLTPTDAKALIYILQNALLEMKSQSIIREVKEESDEISEVG